MQYTRAPVNNNKTAAIQYIENMVRTVNMVRYKSLYQVDSHNSMTLYRILTCKERRQTHFTKSNFSPHSCLKTIQIIRYRTTATLRRPHIKQYTASNERGLQNQREHYIDVQYWIIELKLFLRATKSKKQIPLIHTRKYKNTTYFGC